VRTIFVDASFYVALLFERDRLHPDAVLLSRELDADPDVRFVTTHAVLLEVFAFLSGLGEHHRSRAAALADRLEISRATTVYPVSPEAFAAGIELYRRRPDKTYSLCDCISMEMCRERRITEILTHDDDFAREGFTVLL
jgi:predicted nucleic acid-binding protein